MTGNAAIKCDSTNNSVSKFFGLLNSKSALDLIRNKKCQQTGITNQSNNPQLRRSFKLLKAHRSESNLPTNLLSKQSANISNQKKIDQSFNNNFQSDINQLTKPISTGSLCEVKMKSNSLTNEPTITAQITNTVSEAKNSANSDDESPPPTPPIRNSSLRPSTLLNQQPLINKPFTQLPAYPNFNRELPSIPVNEDKRQSIAFNNRLSPISDDGGFNSFDFPSSNKRNSITVAVNNRNSINQCNNFRNHQNLINQHQINQSSNFDKWSNLHAFDNQNNFQDTNSNLFTSSQRHSYFSDVSDLDYQNINSNNYQKSDNWSSSTSVLSTYTGITSSSTSDYYTASSETITNSPSLNSLNSAGICSSSINTCNSPPLISKSKVNNLTKLYSNSALANNQQNNYKNVPYMNQFAYPTSPGSQLPNPSLAAAPKLAKSLALPSNTGLAISSLVEKPKRQESASVLYYIVAKDSQNSNTATHPKNNPINKDNHQFGDKENQIVNNKSYLNEQFNDPNHLGKNQMNYNNGFLNKTSIQKSLQEFYLRHRNNSKDNQSQIIMDGAQQQQCSNNLIGKNSAFNSNLNNYSSASNDSTCSSSLTESPTNSPTLFSSVNHSSFPIIPLPTKPSFLNKKELTPEEEQRLNELKPEAIYTNIHFNQMTDLSKEEESDLNRLSAKELRRSFKERCSPFESNLPMDKKSAAERKLNNELKKLKNQPNNVKSIAKQFDSLSNLNCDLNANRVSPLSLNKSISKSPLNNENLTGNLVESIKKLDLNESTEVNNLEEMDKTGNDNLNSDDLKMNNESVSNQDETQNEPKTENDFQTLDKETCRLKIKENENQVELFLNYLKKKDMPKAEFNKITLHIEEVDKVTKLVISLKSRLNKIETILQLRNQQINNEATNEQSSDQVEIDQNKFKQSTSTDSLLNDDKNLFSSILSLSSISLNNLNYNSAAFFTSIEMLNSKKNKILDQLEEATALKQMIERRCTNLNSKIICKYFDLKSECLENDLEFGKLNKFNFVHSMQDKHELLIKYKVLEQNARLEK